MRGRVEVVEAEVVRQTTTKKRVDA